MEQIDLTDDGVIKTSGYQRVYVKCPLTQSLLVHPVIPLRCWEKHPYKMVSRDALTMHWEGARKRQRLPTCPHCDSELSVLDAAAVGLPPRPSSSSPGVNGSAPGTTASIPDTRVVVLQSMENVLALFRNIEDHTRTEPDTLMITPGMDLVTVRGKRTAEAAQSIDGEEGQASGVDGAREGGRAEEGDGVVLYKDYCPNNYAYTTEVLLMGLDWAIGQPRSGSKGVGWQPSSSTTVPASAVTSLFPGSTTNNTIARPNDAAPKWAARTGARKPAKSRQEVQRLRLERAQKKQQKDAEKKQRAAEKRQRAAERSRGRDAPGDGFLALSALDIRCAKNRADKWRRIIKQGTLDRAGTVHANFMLSVWDKAKEQLELEARACKGLRNAAAAEKDKGDADDDEDYVDDDDADYDNDDGMYCD